MLATGGTPECWVEGESSRAVQLPGIKSVSNKQPNLQALSANGHSPAKFAQQRQFNVLVHSPRFSQDEEQATSEECSRPYADLLRLKDNLCSLYEDYVESTTTSNLSRRLGLKDDSFGCFDSLSATGDTPQHSICTDTSQGSCSPNHQLISSARSASNAFPPFISPAAVGHVKGNEAGRGISGQQPYVHAGEFDDTRQFAPSSPSAAGQSRRQQAAVLRLYPPSLPSTHVQSRIKSSPPPPPPPPPPPSVALATVLSTASEFQNCSPRNSQPQETVEDESNSIVLDIITQHMKMVNLEAVARRPGIQLEATTSEQRDMLTRELRLQQQACIEEMRRAETPPNGNPDFQQLLSQNPVDLRQRLNKQEMQIGLAELKQLHALNDSSSGKGVTRTWKRPLWKGRVYTDDSDRMVYVSWIPKKARAFTIADKRKMELDLKKKLREGMGLECLSKVLLFPPQGVHCKLIFQTRLDAAEFMDVYGGENASAETEHWKVDMCRLYDIDMHERFDRTVVKIEWSQK